MHCFYGNVFSGSCHCVSVSWGGEGGKRHLGGTQNRATSLDSNERVFPTQGSKRTENMHHLQGTLFSVMVSFLLRAWTALTGSIQRTRPLTNWSMKMKGSEVILQNFMPVENQCGLTTAPTKNRCSMPIKTKKKWKKMNIGMLAPLHKGINVWA